MHLHLQEHHRDGLSFAVKVMLSSLHGPGGDTRSPPTGSGFERAWTLQSLAVLETKMGSESCARTTCRGRSSTKTRTLHLLVGDQGSHRCTIVWGSYSQWRYVHLLGVSSTTQVPAVTLLEPSEYEWGRKETWCKALHHGLPAFTHPSVSHFRVAAVMV